MQMKIVVTGASGGIGKEIVKNLAGYKEVEVIAISRSANLLETLKKQCLKEYDKEIDIIYSDFSKAGFQNDIRTHLQMRHKAIDVLINNAGFLVNKSFGEMNSKDIQQQMRINFEAPYQLTQALLPIMGKSKNTAHVVNIGSMGGYQGSQKFPGLSAYSASKGALAILTECLAVEYRDRNIAFNCLALGSADTEMLRKAFPTYKSNMSAKEMADFISDFALNGQRFFNGKILPVAGLST